MSVGRPHVKLREAISPPSNAARFMPISPYGEANPNATSLGPSETPSAPLTHHPAEDYNSLVMVEVGSKKDEGKLEFAGQAEAAI